MVTGDFLIILTIYIKFGNFTDSIKAIAEDIFLFFSVMFATNTCLQKVKRFKILSYMYVL